MSLQLRLLLIVGSVITLLYFLFKIRKAKLYIEDSIFWIFFSFVMILISLFPQIVSSAADLLGVISPVNFLFLIIIFVLLIRVFSLTLKVSMLSGKLVHFSQLYAINKTDEENEQEQPDTEREENGTE